MQVIEVAMAQPPLQLVENIVNCQFLFNIVGVGFAKSVNILFKQIIQAQ
jgi:hypothetical protein